MADTSIDAALKVLFKSPVGTELLNYVEKQIAKENSSTIKSPAGKAGAIPDNDSAPLVGGPRLADSETADSSTQPALGYVDDWNSTNFNQHNSQTMSDMANGMLIDGHGTNGTPYDNRRR